MVKRVTGVTELALLSSIQLILMRSLTFEFNSLFIGWLVWIIALWFLLIKAVVQSLNRLKINIQTLLLLFPIGFLGSSYNLLLIFGLKLSLASHAAILLRLDIPITAILGYIFLKERIYFLDILAIVLMIWGSLKVMGVPLAGLSFASMGDLLFIAAGLSISINAVLIKVLLRDLHRDTIAFYNLFYTVLLYTFYLLSLGKWPGLPILLKVKEHWLQFIGLGAITGIMYIIYYSSLEQLHAWVVRTLLLSVPIFTTILAYIFLKESLNLSQIIGMGAVIAGGATIVCNPRRK